MNPLSPISLETVLEIHRLKVVKYGGLAGLRDKGLLEAAIAQPWQSFDGIDLYPSLPEKAARIGFEVITQHPFNDGNKRTGAALVGVLLRANGVNFKPRSVDEVGGKNTRMLFRKGASFFYSQGEKRGGVTFGID